MTHIAAVGHEIIRFAVCLFFVAVVIGCIVASTDIIY